MQLTDIEKKILAGEEGEAKQIAMEILTNIGEAMEADFFVQVSSVQAMAQRLAGKAGLHGRKMLCSDHSGPGFHTIQALAGDGLRQ